MFLKRLSPRTLIARCSSSSPTHPTYSHSYSHPDSRNSPRTLIARCSSSSPTHPTYSHSYSHPDSRNVRVSVWWDLENCFVPSGVNVFRGAEAITAAIKSSGIKGPIDITAFGDIVRLSRTNQEAFSSNGIDSSRITLAHTPHGEEDNGYMSLFLKLIFYVQKSQPPEHLFLITVDDGFTSFLHSFRMRNFNILLASKESAPAYLRSAATIMWNWDTLVTGENLTGRYYNQPPNDIWYGHYEGPIENPFTEIERAAFVPDDQPCEVEGVADSDMVAR